MAPMLWLAAAAAVFFPTYEWPASARCTTLIKLKLVIHSTFYCLKINICIGRSFKLSNVDSLFVVFLLLIMSRSSAANASDGMICFSYKGRFVF